ncbi:MAG: DUF5131 family protein [Brachybacterium paraconglomeratum]|nr:DUF5131 family protein [Brachybacterium paraconglomeratum]
MKFLSLEPLLGPLPNLKLKGIDWVIVGGESGPRARPTHPARVPVRRIDSLWVRGAVDVLDLATGPLTDSDHRPVVSTLRARTAPHDPGPGPGPESRTVWDLD